MTILDLEGSAAAGSLDKLLKNPSIHSAARTLLFEWPGSDGRHKTGIKRSPGPATTHIVAITGQLYSTGNCETDFLGSGRKPNKAIERLKTYFFDSSIFLIQYVFLFQILAGRVVVNM